MPQLDNPRQERFCQEFVRCGVASEAYTRAGYDAEEGNSVHACASRMLTVAKVQQRVKELQERAAKRHNVTIDSLVEELETAQALAAKIEQPATMVAATTAKAKITGLMIQKVETGQPGEFDEGDLSQLIEDTIEIALSKPEVRDAILARLLSRPEEGETIN